MERGLGNGSGMDSAVIRGEIADRMNEPMGQPDWMTAEKAARNAHILRKNLCTVGDANIDACRTCESQCAFGKKAAEMVDSGLIQPWNTYKNERWYIAKLRWEQEHKRKKRREKWIERKHEEMDMSKAWLEQMFKLFGKQYEDWNEWVMEWEAREQVRLRGAPEWPEDAEDVDVNVVSGLVRLHGFHVFDVMVG